MATTRKKAAPTRKPTVPTRRRVAGKLVPFNPGRAMLALVSTLDEVADSLGFWMDQLRRVECPGCGFTSLCVTRTGYGIDIECERRQVDKCDYVREVAFRRG